MVEEWMRWPPAAIRLWSLSRYFFSCSSVLSTPSLLLEIETSLSSLAYTRKFLIYATLTNGRLTSYFVWQDGRARTRLNINAAIFWLSRPYGIINQSCNFMESGLFGGSLGFKNPLRRFSHWWIFGLMYVDHGYSERRWVKAIQWDPITLALLLLTLTCGFGQPSSIPEVRLFNHIRHNIYTP